MEREKEREREKTATCITNIKLAIFYDWIFFTPRQDSVFFFSISRKPRVERYKNLRALNRSPPRKHCTQIDWIFFTPRLNSVPDSSAKPASGLASYMCHVLSWMCHALSWMCHDLCMPSCMCTVLYLPSYVCHVISYMHHVRSRGDVAL